MAGDTIVHTTMIKFCRFPGNGIMTIGAFTFEVVWVNPITAFDFVILNLRDQCHHLVKHMTAGTFCSRVDVNTVGMALLTFQVFVSIRQGEIDMIHILTEKWNGFGSNDGG